MPGLNLAQLKWDGTLASISEFILSVYEPSVPGIGTAFPFPSSAFYTPYQFTLPILQALYFQLVSLAGENKGFKRIEDTRVKYVKKGYLRAINPETRDDALKTSLRAVAYYSWEPGSRLFLIRRVFPTYFDFLSVSHIPEGWGASSLMLNDLGAALKDRNEIVNGSFYTAVNMLDIGNLSYNLPYLAEQQRLKYDWVVVLPVFQDVIPTQSDRNMLGAFVFFLAGADVIPAREREEGLSLKMFFQGLCGSTSKIVSAHNARLAPSNLAALWKDTRKRPERAAAIVRIALKCFGHVHQGKSCQNLDDVSLKFLRALEGPEYYVLRDNEDQKDEAAVFLVAARPSISSYDFKKTLLRLLAERLGDEAVICDMTITDYSDPTGTAFSLKTDHGWLNKP